MAKVKPVPAPVGGWNARDSLDGMKEDEAYLLDNWIPDVGKCRLRNGYSSYATGMTSNVETLAEFNSGATHKFLAASNGNIWDISSAGAASSLGSGFGNNRWQWVNFDAKLGLVNGADAPQVYDGSTLGAMTISGSGLTVSTLIGVNSFKSRTYFWANNSQDFWYSAVDTLGGALTKFPLSRVGTFGGYLMSMSTWTRDGGAGADDLAVFTMSSGEVIVYSGSDPGSDFSLIGIFHIGAPLSIRGTVKIGADLVVMTKNGYVPLSKVLPGLQNTQAISDQISGAVSDAAQSFASNYGWQAILYPRGNLLMFNVPATTNATYYQHVFNTITGKPCRFKGINARCWGIFQDKLYFGGSGSVYLFDDGASDNGSNIEGDAITAPNYLGSRGNQKLLTGIQAILSSDGDLPVATAIGVDFTIPSIPVNASTYAASGAVWDTATWDDADWTGGDVVTKQWHSASGMGFNFMTRLKVAVNSQTANWYSTNYMFKPGGLI